MPICLLDPFMSFRGAAGTGSIFANLSLGSNKYLFINLAKPRLPTSPNDTISPPAPQIVDSLGNIWTIVGGVANENGVPTQSSNIVAILWHQGSIYVQNNNNTWFVWQSATSTFVINPGGDPRPGYLLQASGSRILLGDGSGAIQLG